MKRRAANEGTVCKRGDGRWCAALSVDGRRKFFYAKTQQAALAKLREAQRALADGLPLSDQRRTVGGVLTDWLEAVAPNVRPRTLVRYREIASLHLIPALGNVRLARLTPAHVEKLMASTIAAGASPRTAAHCRAVLREALNAAMRWAWVGRNAASLAQPPRIPEREVRPLSLADARAVLLAVTGDRLEALFTVALAVGLRQGEALGLRWPDLDLDGGTLSVQRSLQRVDGAWAFVEPKTARSRRTVPLPAQVVVALREHRSRQLQERLRLGPAWEGEKWGDLVFADEAGGPLSGFHVSRRFKALLAMAGLPGMRYHELRHGAASLMAALGVPVRVAMEILGHSQISTTMNVYAHVAPDLGREAADRVASALWGN